MNKKLFGTLLLGSLLLGGTFVSCKDYDDDIENLQGQITDVKALVAQLQSKLDGMTYVQSVTKSADDKTIKFTMSNGQTVEFTDTDTPGSVVTVEDGVLCIDGKPTEIKASSAINMPKVENGQIYIFNEETGKYAATGIFVNQNTVVESATKYTITMTTSDGTTVTYDVPKASGLITEIKVKPYTTSARVYAYDAVNGVFGALGTAGTHNHAADNIADFEVAQYDVTNSEMADWKGPKPALKNGNKVFGFGELDVRVNPVTVDLKGIEFSLVNTMNAALPTIALKASAESGWAPIDINNIGTRANDGNGLWTLSCENMVIPQESSNTLNKKIGPDYAYAVTAGDDVRSSYNVHVIKIKAPELSQVYFWKGADLTSDEFAKVDGTDDGETTLDVNKAYTLRAKEGEQMALYDVYMTVSDLDKETYGIVIDNEARTVKYTKKPDVVTTDNDFYVTIETADNEGKVKTCKIKVNLSSLISTNASFEAQTYDLTKLNDGNDDTNSFTVALDPMKNALGATDYNRWANNVDLTSLTSKNVQYFTDASCADWTKATALNPGNAAPTISFVKADGKTTATDVNDFKFVKFNVDKNNSALKIGKQYYAKVTFMTKGANSTVLNSIVIPVKFTAPSVADQFKPKAGYVVDGVINAYFYEVGKITVDLNSYFDAADQNATLEMKGDDNIVTTNDNKKWSSDHLAYFAASTVATGDNFLHEDLYEGNKSTKFSERKHLVLTADKVDPVNDPTEAGYGKTLTVNVSNSTYSGTKWEYGSDADKQGSFQIKLMSPIFEGTIKPATGASVKLVANNVDGSNITSEMIVATDYTGTNRIEIMPDAEGATTEALAWSNTQIKEVAVSKDETNTYISGDPKLKAYTKADNTTNPATPAKLGYINVKANPVANDVDTHIYVSVTDAWGYTNKIKLPVTITKQ